ncbi:MAG: thioredoxin domain-containing protein, partial [Solirubrobacterales bacterium]
SVDERWHIPHFEKMLYDNALLARNYLHAWQETGEVEFADVARSTLDWMIKELRGDEGGFASALDADSLDESGHLEEGAFYAWDKDELIEVAATVDTDVIDDLLTYWGVIDHGEFEGRNVLFVNAAERKPPADVLTKIRDALYDRRAARPWPARDDKRITSWNALAIAALAEAGAVLGEQRYTDAAVECAEFVERELRTPDGRLRRSWLDGRIGPAGYLEDHAYVAGALLTLYENTFDERWFLTARSTADAMIDHFADRENGGFFSTADDHEQLLVRRKELEDSPIPGGNAAAAFVLLRLAALTGDQDYRGIAAETLRMLAKIAARYPSGFGHTLQGVTAYLGPAREVALVGDPLAELAAVVRRRYRPANVVAGSRDPATSVVPLLDQRTPVNGKAAAYVCEQFACQRPVTAAQDLEQQLLR